MDYTLLLKGSFVKQQLKQIDANRQALRHPRTNKGREDTKRAIKHKKTKKIYNS